MGEKTLFQPFPDLGESFLTDGVLRLVLNLKILKVPRIIKVFFRIDPNSVPNSTIFFVRCDSEKLKGHVYYAILS